MTTRTSRSSCSWRGTHEPTEHDRGQHRGRTEEGLRDRGRLAGMVALREDRGAGGRRARGLRAALRDRREGGRRSLRTRRLRGRRADRRGRRHRVRRPVLDYEARSGGPWTRRRPSGRHASSRPAGRSSRAYAPGAPRRTAGRGPRGGGRGPERQDGRPRRQSDTLYAAARIESPASGRSRRTAQRSKRCGSTCWSTCASRPTACRSPSGHGPPATPHDGSPGMPSTMPGRWRTGPSPSRPVPRRASPPRSPRSAGERRFKPDRRGSLAD